MINFTPPSFSLVLSPEKSPPRPHSLHLTAASLEIGVTSKQLANLTLPATSDQQSHQAKTKIALDKDPIDLEMTKKGKELAIRQQPMRVTKEMPFICRSPYLKDYKRLEKKLKPAHIILVDYAFL